MKDCGNRSKARRFYERKRGAEGESRRRIIEVSVSRL
ncbi:hypothetical protein H8E65_10100 [Candidatus Bathyarchaeota archaeon]|nr:hypothetical protein [Candidatus Bathyarchaeota archaeon]